MAGMAEEEERGAGAAGGKGRDDQEIETKACKASPV